MQQCKLSFSPEAMARGFLRKATALANNGTGDFFGW